MVTREPSRAHRQNTRVTALEIDTPHGPARVDVDFLTGPRPTGTFQEPSGELVAEKQQFGTSRRARWFNR